MRAFLNAFLSKQSPEDNMKFKSNFDPPKLNFNAFLTFIKKHQKDIFFLLTVILAVCVVILTTSQNNTPILASENMQAKRSQIMMSQLNDISDKVQVLQASPQSGTALRTTLSGISNDIAGVKQSLDAMRSDMDDQMSDIRKAVSQNPNAKQYLDSKELPFKVISIDVIAQQPYASIDYDHHITALGVGDALAGWRVTKADYQAAMVEFKNAKDQYIKVIMQG